MGFLKERSVEAVILKLQHVSESLGGHVKSQLAGPHPQVSDPVDLGWN